MGTLLGLLIGCGLGGAIALLVAAVRGWTPRMRTRRGAGLRWSAEARRRAAFAVAAALAVLVATRWPVASGATGALIWLWPKMFGAGRDGAGQIERLEALATWTESLRDTIAGSVGLEQAITHSLDAAPNVLHPSLQRLVGRLSARIPLPHALAAFADELDDSMADLVIAALILNARLRGPGLVQTLTALSESAREELDMRRRVEERRRSLRRTATIIVVVTGLFAGAIAIFSRAYVAPYGSVTGQVMLVIVLAVFAGGLMWMRQAANLEPPVRFLVGVDEVDQALAADQTREIGVRR